MKTIIAGGRNYSISEEDEELLGDINITEVVSGCARGADTGGEAYAIKKGIPVAKFPANWERFGRAAGHIRNREMAEYADAVVLFPGGAGTDNMCKEAMNKRLEIYDFRWRK